MFLISQIFHSCRVRCLVLLTLYSSLTCLAQGENELLALPKSVPLHPAVTTFFNNDDGFIREVVIPSMERARKSKVHVKIVTSDGTSLQRCHVSAELQKHEFLFGHCNLATEKVLEIDICLVLFFTLLVQRISQNGKAMHLNRESMTSQKLIRWLSIVLPMKSVSSGIFSRDIIQNGSLPYNQMLKRHRFNWKIAGPFSIGIKMP